VSHDRFDGFIRLKVARLDKYLTYHDKTRTARRW